MRTLCASLVLIVLLSVTASAQWSAVNRPSEFDGIEVFLADDLLYIGTMNGLVYGSDDHGETWELVGTGLVEEYNPVTGLARVGDWMIVSKPIPPEFNYRCYFDGDEWGEWTPLTLQDDMIYHFAIIGDHIFAASGGVIQRSVDYGASWAPVIPPGDDPIFKIFSCEGSLFASNNIVNSGAVYRSDDEGESWLQVGPTISSYLCAHTYYDGKLCLSFYHGGAHGTLWHSTNLGDSWEQVTGLPTTYNINGLAAAGPYIAIGASSGSPNNESVWFSVDFGDWEAYMDDLPQGSWPVNEFWSHDGWLFKTGGSVVPYRAPHPDASSVPEGESLLDSSVSAFPNPIRSSAAISYKLQARSPVMLSLHDLQGSLVKTLVSGMKEAGEHSITWRLEADGGSPISSGIYFINLRTDRFESSRKVVVLE